MSGITEERKPILMVVSIAIVFALAFITFLNFKVTMIEGPLEKAIHKILHQFQMKHCEWLKIAEEYSLPIRGTCEADINSFTTALSEAIALTAFVTAILGTILYWKKRLSYVMLGVTALLLFGVAPFELIIEHMELGLILFLISMMIIVEYLSEKGVLEWITIKMIKASKFKPLNFLIMLAFLSWIMAALVDEVTSIVFVTRLVISLSGLIGIEPLPLVMYAVMATNIGSAATMIGNPIGIYIALQSGKSFEDFLVWATPGSLSALLVFIGIGILWLKKLGVTKAIRKLEESNIELDEWGIFKGIPAEYIRAYIARKRPFLVSWLAGKVSDPGVQLNKDDEQKIEKILKEFRDGWIYFTAVILLIAFHTSLSGVVNSLLNALYSLDAHSIHATITPEALLIFSPIIVASIVMLRYEEPRRLVEHGVEWWTLIFFMFLFAIASALSYTGVTDKMAYALIMGVGELNLSVTIMLTVSVAVISALISAFLDNMPVVVALAPVVKTLVEIGLPGADLLWWALLYGATMGGNMSMIGSTANIVALGLLERQKHRVSRFMEWLVIGTIVVVATLGVALLLLIFHGLLVYH
ncbi:SLC13 family permease [Ignicoccus islandicus]|nr:SLC13 family permease [Ignicoccus islandicus]